MADVPDYMVPTSLKEFLSSQEVNTSRKTSNKKNKIEKKSKRVGCRKYEEKKKNPLATMEYSGLKKM